MTASRASRLGAALAVLLATATGVIPTGPVFAQTPPSAAPDGGAPAPAADSSPTGAPTALAPPRRLAPAARPANTAAPAEDERTGGGRSEPAVESSPLATIDLETVGTLGPENGGLGTALWRGTERRFVEEMLPRLPVNASSPTMRDLMRRLLLTSAAAPEGKNRAKSLIALRVRLLAAMGDLNGLSGLLAALPGNVTDSRLLEVEADARFLANDNARACAIAASQVEVDDSAYWQKAMVFCEILAGDPGTADLGLSLLRELGEDDSAFFSLAGMLLSGSGGTLKSLPRATSLKLAMARAAKAQLPPDVVASTNPGVLRTIAVNPNVPPEVRLDAAERAEAAGALATESLRQLYSSIDFSAEDLAKPLSRAREMGGPIARALLYHLALAQNVPTAQAEIVKNALDIARAEGRYGAAARVFSPVVAKIEPSAALLWFAPDAIRLMLSNDTPDGARPWFSLLQSSSLFQEDSAVEVVRLTPLVRLVGTMGLEKEPRDLDAWWAQVKDRPGAAGDAALLYSMLSALGDDVGFAAWRQLEAPAGMSPVAMIHPALWFRLQAATRQARAAAASAAEQRARDGEDPAEADSDKTDGTAFVPPHRGEIVLLGLVGLGEAGSARAAPQVISQVLRSLRAVGLEEEARALALEAALAAGL